ncbi:hypothetical protein SNOG_01398 [Parastagonospora nodorum SN15]|uniref:Uncharacterized protein n=1 Tax=Phaeosphaeria nodorum (strain SN15 / ATCC MYA-4574 / FGSC 10173) TaxID=321614 RepID=Q0V3L6_PHANO|nr:hypothetical protein SNOG_01398 [Parastagonospora nodorum SN15]EAT91047.1 hypothetical protein SNOG_01398 [Parastagonospora nodorum SN15]
MVEVVEFELLDAGGLTNKPLRARKRAWFVRFASAEVLYARFDQLSSLVVLSRLFSAQI